MKKIVSVALAVVMVLSITVISFAAKSYLGDVNGDGKVSSADALWTLKIAAGLEKGTAAQKKAADYNKDGSVTAIDARKILQVAAGLLEPEEMTTTGGSPSIGGGSGDDSISWDEIIGA